MFPKPLFVLIPVFFFTSYTFSQEKLFTPLASDPAKQKTLLAALEKRYLSDIGALSGTIKKATSEIYKERYEMIRNMLAGSETVTDPQASDYLNSLLGEIRKANPGLDTLSLRVVFSRSWQVNASSMGEGTIFFNIGLLHRLENESQAAFALCHELAHYLLDHGNISIRQYVSAVQSDELQKQLKNIQKSEFRRNQQLEVLARDMTFRTRRHNRSFEQAADSMALQLMKNTPYSLEGSIELLALLDSANKDKFDYPLDLQKRFDFESFRFKKSWTESDALQFASSSVDEKETQIADSLKTHPDCQVRIVRIKEEIKKLSAGGSKKFLVSESRFRELKEQFDFEILDYCFRSGRVSLCLYYSLEMLHDQPDNVYLHTMIGKCLNEIYDRQKEHRLGNIVDLPGPGYKEEYNNLLHLIQNTRLQEIAALSYYYLNQLKPRYESNRNFLAAWEKSMHNYIQ